VGAPPHGSMPAIRKACKPSLMVPRLEAGLNISGMEIDLEHSIKGLRDNVVCQLERKVSFDRPIHQVLKLPLRLG
jgi:hypothetical protein